MRWKIFFFCSLIFTNILRDDNSHHNKIIQLFIVFYHKSRVVGIERQKKQEAVFPFFFVAQRENDWISLSTILSLSLFYFHAINIWKIKSLNQISIYFILSFFKYLIFFFFNFLFCFILPQIYRFIFIHFYVYCLLSLSLWYSWYLFIKLFNFVFFLFTLKYKLNIKA